MLLNITTIFVALIAIYLVYDMVELIKARQFSLARSRTYAVLLGLLMCGRMIYGYFTAQPGAEESSIPNRGLYVICTIGLAVVYTLSDLIVAVVKKRDDTTVVRRKLTCFGFMVVLLIFYIWMKKSLG